MSSKPGKRLLVIWRKKDSLYDHEFLLRQLSGLPPLQSYFHHLEGVKYAMEHQLVQRLIFLGDPTRESSQHSTRKKRTWNIRKANLCQ